MTVLKHSGDKSTAEWNQFYSWNPCPTGQPHYLAIVQAWHFSLFSYNARMPDETDAKILTVSQLENWRRLPGRPRTTWIKTIQQDLKSNNLSLDEATDMAQNCPLWRLV